MAPAGGQRVDTPYSQNIRTRLSTGGYAPYHRRTSTCLPASRHGYSPAIWTGTTTGGEAMDWKHLLAYITGTVDQELLLRNKYLVTENRILRNQLKGRIRLSDGERKALAEIGQKLGKKALEAVATIVKPDTILVWQRHLVAQEVDGSTQVKASGIHTLASA